MKRHIEIIDPEKCCGCSGCQCVCPVACISMVPDDKGFLYPQVDDDICIDCGQCIAVCPFINVNEERFPDDCRAALNKSLEERLESSSGGIFILLAKEIISKGGLVFGAVFDESFNVVHRSASSLEEVIPMMKSKYVQSSTVGIFKEVREALVKGREVLFVGTQCQIAGLTHFLRKDYPSLYTAEVVCHGVPAPLVWRNYLNDIYNVLLPASKEAGEIASSGFYCNFRDKGNGWRWFNFKAGFRSPDRKHVDLCEYHKSNLYMRAFLLNYDLRPSCYACQAKSGRSGADIALADFWTAGGLTHEMDDDKGLSAMVVWTDKGRRLLESAGGVEMRKVNYEMMFQGNRYFELSAVKPLQTDFFWNVYKEAGLKKACIAVGIYSPLKEFLRKIKRRLKR